MQKRTKWILVIVIIAVLVAIGIAIYLAVSGSYGFGGIDFSSASPDWTVDSNMFDNTKMNPFTE